MKLKDELAESKAITEREISLRDGKEKNGLLRLTAVKLLHKKSAVFSRHHSK